MVTPKLPNPLVNIRAEQLIHYDNGHVGTLLLLYVSGILGFILTAHAANIPYYTLLEIFSNNVNHQLNRHLFTARQWNELERATLLLPEMLIKWNKMQK